MSAPVFSLPTLPSSTDPVVQLTSQEWLEASIQAVVDDLFDLISAAVTELTPKGNFNASGSTFPSGAVAGDFYIVNVAGTVGGQVFAIGDWLIALVNGASTSTYAANWFRADYSQILPVGIFAKYYATTAALALDTQTFATGQRVWAQGFALVAAASGATDHHVTNAGGGKFYWTGDSFPTWTDARNAVAKTPTLTGLEAAAIIGRKPMDAWFFGLRDSASDQSAKLQDAINAAANEGIGTLRFGAGRILSATTIFACHDPVDNPDFPDGSASANSFRLEGPGGWTRQDYIYDQRRNGCILEFTSPTADGLIMANGLDSNALTVGIKGLAVWANTSGRSVVIDSAPQFSRVQDLFIGNNAGGTGLYLRSMWVSLFENIDIYGNDAGYEGKGLDFDTSSGTGAGLNTFINLTTSYFAIGQEYGAEETGTNVAQRSNTGTGLQARFCGEGINVLAGFASHFIGTWLESNDVADIRYAQFAQRSVLENSFCGSATGVATGGASEGVICIGRAGDTAAANSIRGLTIRNFSRMWVKTGAAGIRKHISSNYVPVELSGIEFLDQGGVGIRFDNSEVGVFTLGEGINWSTFLEEEKICDTVGGAVRWDAAIGPGVQGIRDTTTNLAFKKVLAERYYVETAGGNKTVTLPADRATFQGFGRPTSFIKRQTANNMVLDTGSGNTVGGISQTYTIAGGVALTGVTLIPVDTGTAIRWDVAGRWAG